jgi:hypothetical protein
MANTGGTQEFTSIFRIPGNVKMQLLPFVINPNGRIHTNVRTSSSLAGAQPQVFTYRNIAKAFSSHSDKAQLNFLPSTFRQLENDISFKTLYGKTDINVSIDDILDSMPSIQIREFLPDTVLDQLLNFFQDILNALLGGANQSTDKNSSEATNVDSGKKVSQEPAKSENPLLAKEPTMMEKLQSLTGNNVLERLVNVVTGVLKYIAGNGGAPGKVGLIEDLTLMSSKPYSNLQSLESYLFRFPLFLYTALQSNTTTNIYEVPYSSKNIYTSDGAPGFGEAKVALKDFTKGTTGLLGKTIDKLLSNVRINYMPYWNSEQGTGDKTIQIDVTFDLVNDTLDAAINNFLFVNTLIPGNKWIQYGFLQHSPNLYDIKISGLNRYFICTGAFTVTYGGLLRDVTDDFLTSLCEKHLNPNIKDGIFTVDYIKKNKLIKIPDVYKVTLKFASVLPDNYNTQMFHYYNNTDMSNDVNYTKAYRPNEVASVLDQAINNVKDVVTYNWSQNKDVQKS